MCDLRIFSMIVNFDPNLFPPFFFFLFLLVGEDMKDYRRYRSPSLLQSAPDADSINNHDFIVTWSIRPHRNRRGYRLREALNLEPSGGQS